jgi:hypothetical protein
MAPQMRKAETSSKAKVKKGVKVEKDEEVCTPKSNQPDKSHGSKQTTGKEAKTGTNSTWTQPSSRPTIKIPLLEVTPRKEKKPEEE